MAAEKYDLTDKYIKEIEHPKAGERVYWDIAVTGLGVRVTPTSKVFIWRRKLGLQSRKLNIGETSVTKLLKARNKAIGWNQQWEDRKDVKQVINADAKKIVQANLEERNTFAVAYKAWIERKKGKPSTTKDRRKVCRWIGGEETEPEAGKPPRKGGKRIPLPKPTLLWSTPFKEVTTHLVALAIEPYLDRPSTAKKIYSYCSTAFSSEAANHGIAINPFETWFNDNGIDPVNVRDKFLDINTEADRKWLQYIYAARASDDESLALQADYILCCLFWGGRATETARLKIEDVHKETVKREFGNDLLPWSVFVRGDTKNGNAHYFPLTPLACIILDARTKMSASTKDNKHGWLFPSRDCYEDGSHKHITGWGVRRLLDDAEENTGKRIRPHDLRRTMATDIAVASDHNKYLVKLSLNHGKGVTGGYIMAQANVDVLRKQFLKREARFKRILGLEEAKKPLSASLRKVLANLDPATREAALELLGG